MMCRVITMTVACCLLFACKQSPKTEWDSNVLSEAKIEAREDLLQLVKCQELQAKIKPSVTAVMETAPILAKDGDDAADDPAIWVNPASPSESLIYGSNKKGGLAVYDLAGKEVGYYPLGEINNVDIIYDYPYKDSTITVLGCSNRTYQSMDLLKIEHDGTLVNIASDTLRVDTTLIDDIYGFCFARVAKSKKPYCIINGKNGLLQQFDMLATDSGIELSLARSIQFPSQTEGMVADNTHGYLYVGEEAQGVWKLPIDPEVKTEKSLLKGSTSENKNITYDIEGISMYEEGDSGYLVVSSQGNFTYAVYNRTGDNDYLGSFKVIDSPKVDGVQETDGIAIVRDSLSVDFPKGIVVLQDGFNFDDGVMVPQNFKYVDWREVISVLDSF